MIDRNPSPKSRFLASKKAVEAHNHAFSLDAVRISVDMALLQYQTAIMNNIATDVVSQAANHNRLRGAHEFISILFNLGESANQSKVEVGGNLQHEK